MRPSKLQPQIRAPEIRRERLDSWKEIANYLNRDERTVRRWEAEGLPVHRKMHKKQASVYAYKGEIDDWWHDGRQRLERAEQADLNAVGEDLISVAPAESYTEPFRHSKRRLQTAAISAVLVIAAGVAFWIFRQGHTQSSSTLHVNIFPLTGSISGESDPAFSPDGKQLAYIAQNETQHNYNIYVKLIGAGRPLRLTSNAEQERFPAWSPDGRYIAFLRNTVQGNDVYVVPALGGPEHKLTQASGDDCSLSWSPDGNLLAMADRTSNEPNSIFLFSIENGQKWKATSPPRDSIGDLFPVFSPDGHTLAFMRGASRASDLDYNLYVQAIAGHAIAETVPRQLTFDNTALPAGLDWASDGHSIVFSSGRSGSLRLWRVGLDGSLSQLAEPSDNGAFPSISRTGGRLAYRHDAVVLHGSDLASNESIYGLKVSGMAQGRAPARFCPSSNADVSPQFSPDGTRVVFSSNRSGRGEIWLCNRDGSGATQLTSLDGFSGSPQWSPDGGKVAFDHIVRAGRWEIMVTSVEQALPVRVTSGISNGERPSWSNDGKWVYFASKDVAGNRQVWKVSSQGGTPLQVTRHGGFEAKESLDRKFVYYTRDSAGTGIWRIPVDGGEETRVLSQVTSGFWAMALRGIYFVVSPSSGAPAVNFFDFATQRVTQFALMPEDTLLNMNIPGFAISPDAYTVLYVQTTPPGNIMVVENFP